MAANAIFKIYNAEALFDHFDDPREFNNIANRPGSAAIIEHLSKALPTSPTRARADVSMIVRL